MYEEEDQVSKPNPEEVLWAIWMHKALYGHN